MLGLVWPRGWTFSGLLWGFSLPAMAKEYLSWGPPSIRFRNLGHTNREAGPVHTVTWGISVSALLSVTAESSQAIRWSLCHTWHTGLSSEGGNVDFSEPPRCTDSKKPIFIFCQFLGLVRLRGLGGSLVRILGVPSIEPFLGRGRV